MKKLLVAFLIISPFVSIVAQTSDSSKSNGLKKAPWFVERFSVSAGFFIASNNTNIRLGNNSGSIGSIIDFENDLGFDKQITTFATNLQWRSSRRSRFDLSYYQLNRTATYTIKKTFQFGDNTYNVNANVNSFFNNSIYKFSWGYALLSNPKAELGLSLGIHTMVTNFGIAVNGAGIGLSASDRYSFTAPLPNLGVWGGYALTSKLAAKGEFSYLSLKSGGIDGKIIGYQFSLLYKVAKNVDLALGYSGFNFDINATGDKRNAGVAWGYNGPSLSATYSFGKKRWAH